MSYTKLHGSLLTSTIWREPHTVRIVWITMLALADKNGEVMASIPGLADVSRVSIDECIEALSIFLKPDPYSRSKTLEGRRIQEIRGGWSIVNHPEYRLLASKEDNTAKASERMARWRRNKSLQGVTVTHRNGSFGKVTQDRDIAEAEAEAVIPNIVESKSNETKELCPFVEKNEEILPEKKENALQCDLSHPKPPPAVLTLQNDQTGLKSSHRAKGKVIGKDVGYHKDARTVLHFLNEASGKAFRETDGNLKIISERLAEPGVDVEGMKEMIVRQCQLWGGTEMAQYIRPETLFRASKFDSYYGSRKMPVEKQSGKRLQEEFRIAEEDTSTKF